MIRLIDEEFVKLEANPEFQEPISLEFCAKTQLWDKLVSLPGSMLSQVHRLRICHLDLETEIMYSWISRLKHLTRFDLEQTHLSHQIALKITESIPHITSLTIGICRFYENSLSTLLSQLPDLTRFELFQSTLDESPDAVDQLIHSLPQGKNINSIRVCNNFIQDADLVRLLSTCSTLPLETFELVHQAPLTPAMILPLHKLRDLKSLTLQSFLFPDGAPRLSEDTLRSIQTLIQLNPSLQEIDLGDDSH